MEDREAICIVKRPHYLACFLKANRMLRRAPQFNRMS
jgi:hypothetical protein